MSDEKDTKETETETTKGKGRAAKKTRVRSTNHQAKHEPESAQLHAPRGVSICPECRAEYRHDGDDCGSHD